MNPKLTIIIPVYNCEDLLKRALDSVPLSKDYQLILIDDGSEDESWEIIRKWLTANYDKLNERSIGLKFNKNRGIATAMNTGFDLAKGEYIVSLSSDDYYLKDFFDFLPYLDGKNDLVYFDLRINDGSIWHVDEESKHSFVGAVKFIRRKFLGDIRVPDMVYREDVPFSEKLYSKKPKEVFTSIVLKHYNFPREGSLTWRAIKDDERGRNDSTQAR